MFVQESVLIVVDAGNDGIRVVRRKRVVHLHQCLLDVLLQVVVMLVGYLVNGAEYHPLVGAEGRLLLQDDHRADDEEEQERHLPK